MTATLSNKAGQRPRSATVGNYQQQQKDESDVPPVPPLPPSHKKLGNVSAVQLDDLELDDDHMAAITAVVNNSSRDEPPEQLSLHVPSNDGGSRRTASATSKRASTISTISTTANAQPSPQAQQFLSTPDSPANGRSSRRSSLRNSLLVVKDLPEVPSGTSSRPITPTRARATPPSSYAAPTESIAQRLEAANAEPTLSAPVSASNTPVPSAPSTPTRLHADPTTLPRAFDSMEDLPSVATAAAIQASIADSIAVSTEPSPIARSAGVADLKGAAHPADAEAIAAEKPDSVQPVKEEIASAPQETELAYLLDAQASKPADAPEPSQSQGGPEQAIDEINASKASAEDAPVAEIPEDKATETKQASEQVDVQPVPPPAAEPTGLGEPSAQEETSLEKPSAAAAVAVDTAVLAGPTIQTPDEELPGQSWSSSSHPSSPNMMPRTPLGDETAKPPTIASGEESPLITPQRTGSPLAVKQRQVSAPLIREPSDAQAEEKKEKEAGDTGEKTNTSRSASPIGRGLPPVSQRFGSLRSTSLPSPSQRRLSSSSKAAADDPSLDDFVGLMKQVISREKGMSIREAARAAEQRKATVPA